MSENHGIPAEAKVVYSDENGVPIAYDTHDAAIGVIKAVDAHNAQTAREGFFAANKERLSQMAWRALNLRGLSPDDFVMVCIDVDDPVMTPIVDSLMPGHDWDAIRNRGEKPVARGSAGRDGIADVAKDMGVELLASTVDSICCAVFAAGGVSAFMVTPLPEQ